MITAGGLTWLAKFASILASGGQETVSGAPALLYDVGLLLLVGGAVGIALHLTRRNALFARIAASLLALPAFFATFLLLDFLVQPGIPDGWRDYVRDEAGILVTAAVWLVIGLALVFRKRREVP
jgi:hypothetical protein